MKYNNEELEEENNYKDLNELMDYINEDENGKIKNSPKKKKNGNLKTSQKKKKKSKKTIGNNDYLKIEKVQEEDRSVVEFKMKLENDSLNAKDVTSFIIC
jgi:hypothetical protein